MTYQFANCSIDPDKHALHRDGLPVHVEPQVFELLLVLVERQGRLVTKDELIKTVWRGLNVSDATISARMNAARKAVGDSGRDQAIIKTVHGRGFQLIVEVRNSSEMVAAAPNRATAHSIHFTQSSDSAKIAYSQSGDGPPLIRAAHWLSHLELDLHSPVWRPLIEGLESNNTLYRYDQRGTGLSTRDLEGADIDAFANDLKAVADANNLDRFPIFAASQAVPVAIRFAQQYPRRVTGLILYGGYAKGRALRGASHEDIDEGTILGLIRTGWGKADSPFINAFSSLFVPDATASQMASFVRMQIETISPENAARLRQIIDRFDVTDILHSVSAPTLVIHAISDAVQPIEQGRILASEIPNAQYVSLESRNHVPLPQEKSWSQMMYVIGTFLEGLSL
ncbi:winged helix-turn-helix domain-containing protein [Devosia rhodophyticola]|uniref:Winged helix-turn-helix domain-containing protein n=1 Tax=Devosia rhodophyticola TaxID=3026423 RepID=A0ABY7YSY9_9HYPH|nr:alpha/beta fold hydrolase [Devosia rhodophyticola]WDR04491.1 winged helix-turn-helix domain-containing protein [Devosia rhodophyticola]